MMTPPSDSSTHAKGLQPRREEAGHVMVLLIGYVLLTLLVVTVVAAVGSVYLGHKKLLSMADSAALAAADTFVLNGGSTSSDPGTLLNNQGVRSAAESYLSSAAQPEMLHSIVLDAKTGAPDGHTAQVSLTAVVRPMFIIFLIPDGIPIEVTSTARAHLEI